MEVKTDLLAVIYRDMTTTFDIDVALLYPAREACFARANRTSSGTNNYKKITNNRRRIDWNIIYGTVCRKEAQNKGDVLLVSACQYIVSSSFREHSFSVVREGSVDRAESS